MKLFALLALFACSLAFAQSPVLEAPAVRIVGDDYTGSACDVNKAPGLLYLGTLYTCQGGSYAATVDAGVPTNSVANQVFISTASAVTQWTNIPSCADSAGQHLNYDTAGHTFSCGTSLPSIASSTLNDQTNAPAQTPGDAVVDVASNSFTDESSATSTTTISAGQTVSWKWVGGLHVVVSLSAHCSADPCASLEDQRFDSGDPTSTVGHRFAYTFTAPGTYHYYCDVHGQMMQGTVIVNAPQIPALKATTGTRYLCIDTAGNITSSASACSGT